VRGIRIELNGDGICLFHEHDFGPAFEISKVFICPTYSFETAIERMSKIFPVHNSFPQSDSPSLSRSVPGLRQRRDPSFLKTELQWRKTHYSSVGKPTPLSIFSVGIPVIPPLPAKQVLSLAQRRLKP
jgi:hypothetical protein